MLNQPVQEQIDLENIKNQITLSEGELLRLKKLRDSEEYSVSELVKAKKWHEDEIERLKVELESKKTELEELESDKTAAQNTISSAEMVRTELLAEKTEHDRFVAEQKRDISQKHSEIDTRMRASELTHQENMKKNDTLQDTERQLTAIIESVSSFAEQLTLNISNLKKDI